MYRQTVLLTGYCQWIFHFSNNATLMTENQFNNSRLPACSVALDIFNVRNVINVSLSFRNLYICQLNSAALNNNVFE